MPPRLLLALTFPALVLALVVVAGVLEGVQDLVIDYSFRSRSAANPWISGAVYLCLGAVIGVESVDVLPHRFFPISGPISGVSLVLAPLVAGLMTQLFGYWRQRHHHISSWFATFWGGALFAFSIAFIRWMVVGRR